MAEEPTPEQSIDYWKAEAQKAFEKRDRDIAAARAEADSARKAAGLAAEERTELETLRKSREEAEEARAREAGEFDKLKDAYAQKVAEAEAKATAAQQRYADTKVQSAFHASPDLFGPDGLTTMPPEFAYAGFRAHVDFVPGENGTPDRIVVKDRAGEIIRSAENPAEPATFQDGMRQLIETWPSRESILRGSQRAGSGSTGGSGSAPAPADRRALVERAAAGDAEALAQYRASRPKATYSRGRHFERKREQERAAKATG